MIKQETRVLAGYEDIYDKLIAMKDNVEAEVRKLVEEKTKKIDTLIAEVTEVVEVEVADEEVVEPVETTEETY